MLRIIDVTNMPKKLTYENDLLHTQDFLNVPLPNKCTSMLDVPQYIYSATPIAMQLMW